MEYTLRLSLVAVSVCIPVVDSNIALLIIDVQNCFLSGGSLAVTDGDQVIPIINNIRSQYGSKFDVTILTQDWHCRDHVSFASQHPGNTAFTDIQLSYNSEGHLCTNSSCNAEYNISQKLWPDHCVMNTAGAGFSDKLSRNSSDVIVKKGFTCDLDSYSGFFDNGGFSHTELDAKLRTMNITTVVVTGLALDFCVYYTAKDAKTLGYNVYVIKDASRPVAKETEVTALADLQSKGIHIIQSRNIEAVFYTSDATRFQHNLLTILLVVVVSVIFVKNTK